MEFILIKNLKHTNEKGQQYPLFHFLGLLHMHGLFSVLPQWSMYHSSAEHLSTHQLKPGYARQALGEPGQINLY